MLLIRDSLIFRVVCAMKNITPILLVIFSLVFHQALAESTESKKTAPHFLVISCSLNPSSISALLAQQAVDHLKKSSQDVELIDLRKYNLPLSNGHGGSCYEHPQVKEIHDRINKADGVLIASPIYNFSVAASTKNLFELTSHPHKTILTGKAWQNKVVGFMGASGGARGTYAFFPFINSLIIDAKINFVPSFVMASRDDFDDKKQCSEATTKRIEDMIKDLIRITRALKQ